MPAFSKARLSGPVVAVKGSLRRASPALDRAHRTLRSSPNQPTRISKEAHLMGAMFLLGAASDRLRDFFVSAVFHKITERPRRRSGTSTDYYNKGRFKNDARSRYVTPFSEALYDTLANYDDPIASSVAKLPALADGIENFRLLRNDIVHVIATEEGRRQAHIVNNPPHRNHP
jgi:hypothetical protein